MELGVNLLFKIQLEKINKIITMKHFIGAIVNIKKKSDI